MMLAMSPLRHCAIASLIDNDWRKRARTIAGRRISDASSLNDAARDALSVVVIGRGPSAESMKTILTNDIGFKGEVLLL